MTDSEMAHDRTLTTEQIATAGRADSTDRAGRGQYPPSADRQQPASATGLRPGNQAPAQLLEGDEMQSMLAQWKDIQAEFVDEPRKAVQDADALVADLMQRLARMFATERDQLESRWAGGGEVSTEDLRDGLRRYRSFFERLLAA
ncbi:MAG: hypothetical protein ACRDOA_23415 [Streptosporangiaceae bacterium]